jgi:hypothetical protein
VQPTFAAFISLKGRYYESEQAMTIAEFDTFDVRQLCEGAENGHPRPA